VVGVAKTRDKALLKANDTIRKLFTYRHDILKALINEGYYLVVLPKGVAALPGADPKRLEVSEDRLVSLVGTLARVFYLATATRPADPEFEKQRDRQQYELRVKRLDVTLDNRLRVLFGEARLEKWVSGVEAYFDVHQPRSREQLQRTDPALFSIVEEVMAYTNHPDWRYRP
jgi:hypothetical protein